MLALLKNVLLSALIVVGATIASIFASLVVALVVSLLQPMSHSSAPEAPVAIVFGLLIVAVLTMLAGVVFCFVTLFIAAVTMPPAIWMARILRLPRPAFDVAGGALAALLCVHVGLEEVATGKLSDLASDEAAAIFLIVGMLGGGLAGYLRHRFLVRPAPDSQPTLGPAPA